MVMSKREQCETLARHFNQFGLVAEVVDADEGEWFTQVLFVREFGTQFVHVAFEDDDRSYVESHISASGAEFTVANFRCDRATMWDFVIGVHKGIEADAENPHRTPPAAPQGWQEVTA
jgi:hypothetical protein